MNPHFFADPDLEVFLNGDLNLALKNLKINKLTRNLFKLTFEIEKISLHFFCFYWKKISPRGRKVNADPSGSTALAADKNIFKIREVPVPKMSITVFNWRLREA